MGFDRLGRPILATQYGSLRLWEMTKLTTVERMTELHAREQELLLRVLRRRTLGGGGGGGEGTGAEGRGGKSGDEPAGQDGGGDRHVVDTAVVVIDTAGLTLRHVSTVDHTSLHRCSRPVPVPCRRGKDIISVWVCFDRGCVGAACITPSEPPQLGRRRVAG